MKKFIDQKGYGLVKYESESAKKKQLNYMEKEKLKERDKKYGERERKKLIRYNIWKYCNA